MKSKGFEEYTYAYNFELFNRDSEYREYRREHPSKKSLTIHFVKKENH